MFFSSNREVCKAQH